MIDNKSIAEQIEDSAWYYGTIDTHDISYDEELSSKAELYYVLGLVNDLKKVTDEKFYNDNLYDVYYDNDTGTLVAISNNKIEFIIFKVDNFSISRGIIISNIEIYQGKTNNGFISCILPE